jgi:hypothetical protein
MRVVWIKRWIDEAESDMQQQQWIKTTTNNAANKGGYIQRLQADQREATGRGEDTTDGTMTLAQDDVASIYGQHCVCVSYSPRGCSTRRK